MLRLTLSATVFLICFLSAACAIGGEMTGHGPDRSPEHPFRIVGFGDSLMAGYRLENDQSFPAVLQKALREKGYDAVVDNAGVSGDTTTGGLVRLDWSIPQGTGLVIVELGANDMLRAVPPELTAHNLAAILERLRNRNIPVILAGMLSAPNMGHRQEEKFNAIYPELAKRFNVSFYPFFLDAVAGKQTLLLNDGMHPNKNGVQAMVEHFLPLMEKTLGALGVKPSPATGQPPVRP